MRIVGAVVTVAALVAGVLLIASWPASTPAPPGLDLERDELASLRIAAENYIRVAGYNCPRAKAALPQGEQPAGLTFKIRCGPADRDGVIPALAYLLVTEGPNAGAVSPAR